MRFEAIYEQGLSRSLTLKEAAGLLGVHERSLRLGHVPHEADGLGLSEPPWVRAVPVNEVMELQDLN